MSAVDDRGFCLGQERVNDKSNEIKAMPELLKSLNIKGHIITADAMGCQTEIVKIIRQRQADYVLAVKGNQETLHDDIKQYFEDSELLKNCVYHKTVEKARSSIEIREYWQTGRYIVAVTEKSVVGFEINRHDKEYNHQRRSNENRNAIFHQQFAA